MPSQQAGQPLCMYTCIFNDPLRVNLQGPSRNVVLTPQMEVHNAAMSSMRSFVEWISEIILSFWILKRTEKLG